MKFQLKVLLRKIKQLVNFEGELIYDQDKPDGINRKLLDSSKLLGLGWKKFSDFDDSIKK